MGTLHRSILIFSYFCLGAVVSSCTTAYRKSVGADRDRVVSRVYNADFNMAWQAVLESMKSLRLDVSNRDSGLVQTRWTDNTAEKNFADGDGGVLMYTKAQVRFRVTLMRGFLRGLPAIKVSVQKEQLVQRDALDDLHSSESDGVEEKTLIYRIGRIIKIKMAQQREEEARTAGEMQNSEFNTDGGATSGGSTAGGLNSGEDDLSLDGGGEGAAEDLPFEEAPAGSGGGADTSGVGI